MILDSRNEVESAARAAGVTVKDCRTPEEKAQPLDVNNLAAPAWARWIAADYDGKVWAYENCPAFSGDGMWHIHGWKSHLDTIDMIGIDWRRTLTPVNVEQPTQLWCERCNLPEDICRGHEEITQPSPTVEAIVTLWQQLDGMQECDLAAAMVRADVVRSDQFYALLGMALEAVRSPRYVGEDKDRHARIWDKLAPFLQEDDMAQLRVAQ